MYYANLHLHSTYSDAGFTPGQLVRLGKALGYKALSLTDHETDGGWPEFQRAARSNDILPVLGAEFYANFETHCLHLTALDYRYDDPGIRSLITRLCENMTEWTRRRFERAVEKGWISGLTWEQVLQMCGPDTWICHDTVQYCAKVLRAVPNDFDWGTFRLHTWRDPEVKAWKIPSPTAQEVISTVRNAGGVICWAHPTAELIRDHIQELVELGLNGIEVCHPGMTPEALELAAEMAQKYNLYRSGGTDHTGPMSACGGHLAIPAYQGISEEDFCILMERRLD